MSNRWHKVFLQVLGTCTCSLSPFLANALITQMITEALKTRDPVFSGSVLQCLSSSSAILSRIVCILSSTKEVSLSKSSSSRKEEGNKSCRSWRASIKVGFSSNQRARTAQVAPGLFPFKKIIQFKSSRSNSQDFVQRSSVH